MNQPLALALVVLGVVFVLLICLQSRIQTIGSRMLNKRRTDDAGIDKVRQETGESEEFDSLRNPFLDDTEPPEDGVMNLSEFRVPGEFAELDRLMGNEQDISGQTSLPADPVVQEQDEVSAPSIPEPVEDEPEPVSGNLVDAPEEPAFGNDESIDEPQMAESAHLMEGDDQDSPFYPDSDPGKTHRKAYGTNSIAEKIRSFLGAKDGFVLKNKEGGKNRTSYADKDEIRDALSDGLILDETETASLNPGRVQPQLDLFDDLPDSPPEKPEAEQSSHGRGESDQPEEVIEAGFLQSGDIPDAKNNEERFVYSQIQGFRMISQIDYWAKISGGQDVGCQTVMAFYNLATSLIPEVTQIYGQCLPDLEWRDVSDEPEISKLRDLVITVQLGNMNRPISEASLEKFISLNTRIAKVTGKELTFMASPENAMKQAQSINRFANAYPPVYAITVIPDKTTDFQAKEIHKFASQRGLEPNDAGFYVRHKTEGKKQVSLYSLVNMTKTGTFDFTNLKEETARGVMFYSLPVVHKSPGAAFSEMADSARAFASRLRAQAMSPDSTPLTQEESDRFRSLIESRISEMESFGIVPGSDEASRIFGTDAT